MDITVNEAIKQRALESAFAAMHHAYAPYSHYHVGACVLCHDGTLYPGANIENASFGLTNCAERSALFAAYSNGVRKADIAAVAIVSDGERLATPCGACRQVLSELIDLHIPIILSNGKEQQILDISQLLPLAFSNEDLHHA
ncbi:MAG: cytidine deaminase [Erysipelotrichaceae bacterium]|nr:cytidine deaminase [Erysipelotrichaceae bacterium]